MAIFGYIRVSTKSQLDGNGLDIQMNEIQEKYGDIKIVSEQHTGKTTNRPIFNELINSLVEGDMLVVTTLDRFCRSTEEGLKLITELMDKGVNIHIMNMGLIENSPIGKMIITNLLAFAEFERSNISERMAAGKQQARMNDPNWKEGRPQKYTPTQIKHAIDLLSTYSYKKVSELTGISKSTLIRANNKIKASKSKGV